jgi:hypothetical protein
VANNDERRRSAQQTAAKAARAHSPPAHALFDQQNDAKATIDTTHYSTLCPIDKIQFLSFSAICNLGPPSSPSDRVRYYG